MTHSTVTVEINSPVLLATESTVLHRTLVLCAWGPTVLTHNIVQAMGLEVAPFLVRAMMSTLVQDWLVARSAHGCRMATVILGNAPTHKLVYSIARRHSLSSSAAQWHPRICSLVFLDVIILL